MCLIEGFMALPNGKVAPCGDKQPEGAIEHYVWKYIRFPNLVKYPKFMYFRDFTVHMVD